MCRPCRKKFRKRAWTRYKNFRYTPLPVRSTANQSILCHSKPLLLCVDGDSPYVKGNRPSSKSDRIQLRDGPFHSQTWQPCRSIQIQEESSRESPPSNDDGKPTRGTFHGQEQLWGPIARRKHITPPSFQDLRCCRLLAKMHQETPLSITRPQSGCYLHFDHL